MDAARGVLDLDDDNVLVGSSMSTSVLAELCG
jgi:hypothetical protein